jgi:hypothetical protein
MSTSQTDESATTSAAARETRQDAAATLGAVSAAVKPGKTGMGQKVAIAGTIFRLARRYPVAALAVGGVALAFYLGRRRRSDLH